RGHGGTTGALAPGRDVGEVRGVGPPGVLGGGGPQEGGGVRAEPERLAPDPGLHPRARARARAPGGGGGHRRSSPVLAVLRVPLRRRQRSGTITPAYRALSTGAGI